MTNREKFANDILDILETGYRFVVVNNNPIACKDCDGVVYCGDYCPNAHSCRRFMNDVAEWLKEEFKENI